MTKQTTWIDWDGFERAFADESEDYSQAEDRAEYDRKPEGDKAE